MATVGVGNPPDPPYADGRFSNGKVFAEVIAENFGAGELTASWSGCTIYSYGGTRSMIDRYALPGLLIPSVRHQVMNCLADAGGAADPGALYILHDGGNDSFFASSMSKAGQWDAAVALPRQSAQGIVGSVALLAEHGVPFISWFRMPLVSASHRVSAVSIADSSSIQRSVFAVFVRSAHALLEVSKQSEALIFEELGLG